MTIAPAATDLHDRPRTVAQRPRLAESPRSIVVLGRPTETNLALVATFAELGCRSRLAAPATAPRVGPGDVVLARLDVLPTLDGIERGLRDLPRLKRAGVQLLNGPVALTAAHDKLSTALFLGAAGVEQPATAHVRDATVPSFRPRGVHKLDASPRIRPVCRENRVLEGHARRNTRTAQATGPSWGYDFHLRFVSEWDWAKSTAHACAFVAVSRSGRAARYTRKPNRGERMISAPADSRKQLKKAMPRSPVRGAGTFEAVAGTTRWSSGEMALRWPP
jgi:hypothetical protein